MKPYSVSALRTDLYRLLDRVLATGVPLEIERNGERLQVIPAKRQGRLAGLKAHPGYLKTDAEALVHVDWSGEWRP
jgi:hypothetical protein